MSKYSYATLFQRLSASIDNLCYAYFMSSNVPRRRLLELNGFRTVQCLGFLLCNNNIHGRQWWIFTNCLIYMYAFFLSAGHRTTSQTGHVYSHRCGRSWRSDWKSTQFSHYILRPEYSLCQRSMQRRSQGLEGRTYLIHASYYSGIPNNTVI